MSSKAYYRAALFLPYATILPAYFLAKDFMANQSSSGFLSPQFLGMSWIVISGFWFIPYTIFVIGLLIWSTSKPANLIRSWFLRSPFILMMIAPIIFLGIGMLSPRFSDSNVSGSMAAAALIGSVCSIPLSLVFGYTFVVLALLLYEILYKFGYIKNHNDS